MRQRCLVPLALGLLLLALPATPAAAAAAPTASALSHAGSFDVPDGHGHRAHVTITTGPLPDLSPSDPCAWFHGSTYDVGVIDFLSTSFCWNGRQAVGYNTGGSCTSNLPGGFCQWQHFGDWCGYCWTASAYGQYFQTCAWFFNCSDQLQFTMRGNGSWWFSVWAIH